MHDDPQVVTFTISPEDAAAFLVLSFSLEDIIIKEGAVVASEAACTAVLSFLRAAEDVENGDGAALDELRFEYELERGDE